MFNVLCLSSGAVAEGSTLDKKEKAGDKVRRMRNEELRASVSGFPVANRREARKLGLLRSKSSEAERERHKPAHTVGERGRLHGLCSWRGRREHR